MLLMQKGCDEVQGYLTGRPLPIADYAELVGRKAEQSRKITRRQVKLESPDHAESAEPVLEICTGR